MKQLLVFLLVSFIVVVSCTKNSFITDGDAAVAISEDTLHFDTVFTSTGSVTQFFLIHNKNNRKLLLSNVSLGGGSASYFKINVDGSPGPSVNDIEINANDSVYVFVTVKIDPTAGNLPFIISDSIRVQYNGNERWVQLDAWGQNAHFLRSVIITGNETWTNEKPYVILGGLQIDTNATLTIEKGSRIYLHADAPFIVDGTLTITGEAYDSTRVVFRGDRLDDPYRDFPAAWPGIYFRGESKDNALQYVTIRNAYQGVITEQASVNTNPKVYLKECIIDNCYDAGILGVQSNIKAENCLVSNCGKNIVLAFGGDYDFTHCTVVSYSNNYIQHKEPVLLVANFIKEGETVFVADLAAQFTNCIFWGENGTTEDEVITLKEGSSAYAINFTNCLWKIKNTPANTTTAGMIENEAPLFDSIDIPKSFYNFHLKPESPVINKGITTGLVIDLDGNPRNVTTPDFGCYEKQL